MIQKVIRVGNSLAVTIPKKFLNSQGVKEGRVVKIGLQIEEGKVTLDFAQKKDIHDIVDKEVYLVAKDLLRRYLPAFKELAKK